MRTALVLCLTLLAAAPATSAERIGLQKKVADKLLQAYELMQAEKFDESLAIIDEVARRRRLGPPEHAQIHRFRGYIFVNKGMIEEASQEFEKSLSFKALDRDAEQVMTYSLAQLHTQQGRYPRALELIDAWFAGAETPKPDAYYLKGMILAQQENFDAALEPARTAVEMSDNPRESWVQLLLVIYSQRKDYPKLAATLERIIQISPGKKQYWVQLAAVEKHLGREPKALATLELAHTAELLDDDRELRQLARLMFLRELPLECGETLERAIASQQVAGDADAYRLISNCYIAARESERALEPLAKAGELAPDGEMYTLLGQLHLQRERYEPALDALRKALAKAKPEQRGPVQLLIGVAELGAEEFARAEHAFHAAQSDDKVRRAADSYLKYLAEQRMRREQQKLLRTASRADAFTESP